MFTVFTEKNYVSATVDSNKIERIDTQSHSTKNIYEGLVYNPLLLILIESSYSSCQIKRVKRKQFYCTLLRCSSKNANHSVGGHFGRRYWCVSSSWRACSRAPSAVYIYEQNLCSTHNCVKAVIFKLITNTLQYRYRRNRNYTVCHGYEEQNILLY